jgi:hypothetical protein
MLLFEVLPTGDEIGVSSTVAKGQDATDYMGKKRSLGQ